MPRTARACEAGFCCHVLNRGNARPEVSHKHDDDAFLRVIAEASVRLPMRVLAYCLMPNHLRFLLRPHGVGDLSRWMQRLMTPRAPACQAPRPWRPRLAGAVQGLPDAGR